MGRAIQENVNSLPKWARERILFLQRRVKDEVKARTLLEQKVQDLETKLFFLIDSITTKDGLGVHRK